MILTPKRNPNPVNYPKNLGKLSLREIILCYRRFGQNPTEEEVTQKMALVNSRVTKLDFPEVHIYISVLTPFFSRVWTSVQNPTK